jgi:hypothetical protein
MREESRAIVDAGYLLQIDDRRLVTDSILRGTAPARCLPRIRLFLPAGAIK